MFTRRFFAILAMAGALMLAVGAAVAAVSPAQTATVGATDASVVTSTSMDDDGPSSTTSTTM